jgi:hypothetical protein
VTNLTQFPSLPRGKVGVEICALSAAVNGAFELEYTVRVYVAQTIGSSRRMSENRAMLFFQFLAAQGHNFFFRLQRDGDDDR